MRICLYTALMKQGYTESVYSSIPSLCTGLMKQGYPEPDECLYRSDEARLSRA